MGLIKKLIRNRKKLWSDKGEILKVYLHYLFTMTPEDSVRAETRLSVCKTNRCGMYDRNGESEEAFLKGFQSCGSCGCPLKPKVSTPQEQCPLGYWL